MRMIKVLGMTVAMVVAAGATAFAKPEANKSAVTPLPKAATLADNVVVAPGQAPPATNPPAAPAQTAVQPVEAVPVDNTPRRTTVVHEEPNHNYMSTIAVSALMGGVAGALVGGAIYYLGDQDHPRNIAYWAAGGVLVGTGVGLVQIMAQESRVDNATAMHLPTDPAPTVRVGLARVTF
jgi:hypothetical protein